MQVLAISRLDDRPSIAIARSSCSQAQSTWPPVSGIHSSIP
jgi:hypothetical protein